ncbi:MAG: PAS domain S-box protein, partial [Mucilaginibacter sp.]
FRKLIENSYEGITLFDRNFNIIYESKSARRIVGWLTSSDKEFKILDVTHPDDRADLSLILDKVLEYPGVSVISTHRTKHYDGHYIWVECIYTNHLDDPDIAAIVLNFKDITPEKKADELLARSEKQFRALVENSSDGIGVLDYKGRPKYLSPAFERILGYADTEVMHLEWFSIVYPDDLDFVRSKFQECIDVPFSTVKNIICRATHKNGHSVWLNSSLTNLLNDPAVCGVIHNLRDITQEKTSADQVERNERHYQALVENSADGIAVFNYKKQPLYLSPSFSRILGYSNEEASRLNAFEIMHPNDLAYANARLKECISKPGVPIENIVYRMKHKDGRWIYLDGTFTNFSHDPAIGGIVNNFRDITEETLNLQMLERIKTDLEKIMDGSLDMICTVDANGYILAISAASEAILGYKPGEMISKKLFDFIYPPDEEKTLIRAGLLMKGNNIINFENRYVRKDGSLVHLSWTSSWNEQDQIRYGVGRDVTENKKREAALIESEAKYRNLFENNPIPLFFWDLETLKILECNKAAEEKYGYTKAEFLNFTTKDLWAPGYTPSPSDNLKTAHLDGEAYKRIRRHRKKNGEVMNVEISGQIINYYGRKVTLAMINDVTESMYYIELDKLEKNLLEMNAQSDKSLSEVLGIYLSGIEALHPGMLCSVQEVRGSRLYNLASSSLPKEYLDAVEGCEIGNNVGSCGTSAFLKQKVIVTDIANDIRWTDYREIAGRYQLKACWSDPIMDDKRNVMATFACYHREARNPSEFEKNTIERAGHIFQVILESYRREQALKISNDRFESATEATYDVIWDWDLETGGVYYSENFTKLFGHESGINYDNLPFYIEHVHPDDLERALLDQDDVKYGTMTNWSEDYRFKKADGEYAFVRDRAVVIRDKAGVGIRMIGAIQDITRQKQEEQHLKLLESVITNTTDAVLIAEAEAYDASGPRILFVNEAFTKMTGYAPEEIIGKTAGMLHGPKTDKAEIRRCEEAIRRHKPFEGDIVNYRKNGEDYWKNFSMVPVADETGTYTHWIAIERDITNLKNKELQKSILSAIGVIFNRNSELIECLNLTLERLAQHGNFCLTEIWLIDDEREKINLLAKYAKTGKAEIFSIETADFKSKGKGEGLVGVSWETHKLQYWHYTQKNKNFVRLEEAINAGIKRAYSIPLMYNDEMIGALGLFMDKDEAPALGFPNMFDNFSKTLGAVIRRKKTEQELNQIFNFTPDILCLANVNGYFKKVNPAMITLLEYDENELLTKPLLDFVHPNDKGKTNIELHNIIQGKPTYQTENRYITKSGKVKWLAWTTTQATLDGTIYCSAKDITEKKELADLLYKSTSLARIGAWEVDLEKRIVHWSDITREILETEPDYNPDIEAAAKFYKEGDDRERLVKAMQDAVRYGTPADMELKIVTAQGNTKWVRVLVETEFLDGTCTRLYGSFQDIDIRKRAELASIQALEERNIILESIGDAFFAVDKNWTVTYWNNMAEKALGRPKNEVLDHDLWEVYADSIGSESYRNYHKALETNTAIHFDDYYAPIGKWYEISAYPSASGLSVYFKDITDRKTAERQFLELNENLRKHAKELAISNAELEQFAYVASHDLQEPLRMVTSFLTQLEKKYNPVLDDKGRQYIHFAVDGAKRMRQIILDLLEFSRIGRSNEDQENINLDQLIKEILALYRKQIEETHAKIVFAKLPDIQNYKTPVRQVFQNLISNSLKYQIQGKAPVITIDHLQTSTHWQFSITDNGIGIDPEYFDKIFIIFQRLHDKEEYSGSGMGLAIARKIVENLGGKVWVESSAGKGSTFYFTILKNNMS